MSELKKLSELEILLSNGQLAADVLPPEYIAERQEYWKAVLQLSQDTTRTAEFSQNIAKRLRDYMNLYTRVANGNIFTQLWSQQYPHIAEPDMQQAERMVHIAFLSLATGIELEKLVEAKRKKEQGPSLGEQFLQDYEREVTRGNRKVCETPLVIYL